MDGGQAVARYVDAGLRFDQAAPRGFRVVPYEPWHLRALALQPAQSGMTAHLASDLPDRVPGCGPCWTALVDGAPIVCAGFARGLVCRNRDTNRNDHV